MNALGVSILLAVILVVLLGSKRWALLAIAASILYITQGQQITVFGFNLFAARIVELVAFARVFFLRKEFTFKRLTTIDRLLLWCYGYSTIVFLLRSNVDQAYQIGLAVDAFLCYFTFRGLVEGFDEWQWFLRQFVYLLVPYVGLVLVEAISKENPFSVMGGIELSNWYREGRLRCQGSFRHASILGTLGASFLPQYLAVALKGEYRRAGIIGCVLCVTIIVASNSGGPVNAGMIALLGWAMWGQRTKMKEFRRWLVLCLAGLALTMQAPIWYLPAKISAISGGDGWHRSYLMDVAFKNIGHWWFSGMPISDTADWFPYQIQVTGAADITNEYLSFGLAAGVMAMGLFIGMLVEVFRTVGRAGRVLRLGGFEGKWQEYSLWGMGVMMATHLFTWIGITYFDQFYMMWFLQLAVIVAISENALKMVYSHPAPERVAAGDVRDPSRSTAGLGWSVGYKN
jgi:hypothetical protein